MRILLLGASGFVGETVFSVLNKEGYEMYGTYHSKKPDFEMPDRFFSMILICRKQFYKY